MFVSEHRHVQHPKSEFSPLATKKWTVKDYSDCNWFVRNSYAKILLNRELNAISMLNGIGGRPQNPFFVDSCCLAFEYVEGASFEGLSCGQNYTGVLN